MRTFIWFLTRSLAYAVLCSPSPLKRVGFLCAMLANQRQTHWEDNEKIVVVVACLLSLPLSVVLHFPSSSSRSLLFIKNSSSVSKDQESNKLKKKVAQRWIKLLNRAWRNHSCVFWARKREFNLGFYKKSRPSYQARAHACIRTATHNALKRRTMRITTRKNVNILFLELLVTSSLHHHHHLVYACMHACE